MKTKCRLVLGRRATYPTKLEIEVSFNRNKRIFIDTGFRMPEKMFDKERQCVTGKYPNAVLVNETLRNMIGRIEQADMQAEKDGIVFDAEAVRAAARGDKHGDNTEVLKVFNDYIDDDYKHDTIKRESWEKYRVNFNKFKQFIDEEYKGKLPISAIDLKVIYKLDTWLQKHYQPSTIGKYHQTLKGFFTRAAKQKLISENPYSDYKIKTVHTTKRDALTRQEIAAIEALDADAMRSIDIRLEQVRDQFLLSLYCGLRISDNTTIRRRDIIDTDDGKVLDIVTTKGQGHRLALPLRLLFGGKPESIVNKWLARNTELDTLFPYIPDSKVNERLKTIALMAGVKMNLTFHIARHTCATMLAEKTGNPFTIMQILGHTDIKTSMIYIHNSYVAMKNSLINVKW